MTKEWMLIVNREEAGYCGVTCNSLFFIGLFYAHDEEIKQIIQEKKPIEILENVALPMDGNN